jgi:hypothetical protein
VNCGEHDLKCWREKSHSVLLPVGPLGKEIGLAMKVPANGFFANGCGNDGLNFARKRSLIRRVQVRESSGASSPAHFSPLDAGRLIRNLFQKEYRLVVCFGYIANPSVLECGIEGFEILAKSRVVGKKYPSSGRKQRRDRFKNYFQANSGGIAGSYPDCRFHGKVQLS